ncbi:MAG: isopentenyl phosphate kinase [Nitrososphaerales archaeon]|nr:isopentenyl phosphate kinase [Nitrososphaerales archaeon]
MVREGLTIIKLGGSVITFKDRPLTPNIEAIHNLSDVISKSGIDCVIVHGGGSFGHYYAKEYNITTRLDHYSAEGIAKTKLAMLKLHMYILEALESHNLHPYSLPPISFLHGGKVDERKRDLLQGLIEIDLTPVTFGDIITINGKFQVISGDTLVRMLAESLKPARVIFTMDVDGIYRRLDDPSTLIRTIDVSKDLELSSSKPLFDVTGGIELKLSEAMKIASLGIDVYFVNGLKADYVTKALKGGSFIGTIIKGIGHGRY